MELQNTVKEALNALYHHPDGAVRMQADRWLQDFQRTLDAWQVTPTPMVLIHERSLFWFSVDLDLVLAILDTVLCSSAWMRLDFLCVFGYGGFRVV